MSAVAAQPQPKNWSELPEDLILMIGERFSLYADYVRFRSVCVSWNSVLPKTVHHQHHHFPYLFLRCEDDDEDNNDTCSRGLLSLPENSKIYHLRGLPKEFRSMHCPGSCHGWLVIVDEATPSMHLINPFTRAQLPLPPMSIFHSGKFRPPFTSIDKKSKIFNVRRYFHSDKIQSGYMSVLSVRKVVLSSSPPPLSSSLMSSSSQFQSSNVVAIAIFGGKYRVTAFARPGDKLWTLLASDKYAFRDILFYRDHLYAIRESDGYEISVFHLDTGCGRHSVPKLVDTLKPLKGSYPTSKPYLVESCGDLLVVVRELEIVAFPIPGPYMEKTIAFKVFKLCRGNNDDNMSSTWVQIENLGDRMLFLGVNSSLSLSSHDFPGCRGNCIYFTHHGFHGCRYYEKQVWGYDMNEFDMGVYYLEDERIEPLPLPLQGCTSSELRRLCPPPIWITPNPY